MKRLWLLVFGGWLTFLAGSAAAQVPEKTPTGKGIDPDTVAAYGLNGSWVQDGRRYGGGRYGGWQADAFGRLSFQNGRAAAENGLPGFAFGATAKGKLPAVAVPFGLDFRSSGLTNRDLKHLHFPSNLVLLDLSRTEISEEGLETLASLKNLTWLRLNSRMTNDGLRELAGLTKLTALDLSSNSDISDRGLMHLAPLQNLTTLDLYGTVVTDRGLKELAARKNLTTLHVGGSSAVTEKGLKALTLLENLTHLDVGMPFAKNDAWFKELAAFRKLTSLKVELRHHYTDEGMKALAGLTNLKALDLKGTPLTDQGLKALAGLTNLTTLTLGGKVTGKGLKELAPLKKLTTLTLNSTLTDDALKALQEIGLLHALSRAKGKDDTRPKSATAVISLDLYYNASVTGIGLRALAGLKNLQSLRLTQTKVTDADLKELAALPNLVALNLDETLVTDGGLQHLAALKNLTTLSLRQTKVTDAGLKTLASLKNLTTLDLLETQTTIKGLKDLTPLKNGVALSWNPGTVSDETLGTLRTLGLLHALSIAAAKGEERPKTQDEVVSLNLSATTATNAGLKELVPLKNLTSLTLGERMTLKGLRELPFARNLTALRIPYARSLWEFQEDKSKDKSSHSLLEELAACKHLDTLELGFPTNDLLARLRKLGLLHSLTRAQRKDGGRPQAAEDVYALDLSLSYVSNGGLKELAPLKNLAVLRLPGSISAANGLKELASFKKLSEINFGGQDEVLRQLAKIGLLHVVRGAQAKDGAQPTSNSAVWSLDLRGLSVSAAGLKELAALENFGELDLSYTKVTDKDLQVLAACKNLVTLDLRNTKVTDEGLKALAPLQKLTTLHCPLTNKSVRILRELGLLHAIHRARGKDGLRPRSAAEVASLNLKYHYPVTHKSLKDFAAFQNLTVLDMPESHMGSEGFKELALFKNLTTLNLYKSDVQNRDLHELASLKNLTALDLSVTQVTDKGVPFLAALKNLTSLNLMYVNISEKGVAELRQALPKCAIIR